MMSGSLAGQFAIKAGEANGKGLQSTHRVVKVQGEDILSYSAKLHYNVVRCREKNMIQRLNERTQEKKCQSIFLPTHLLSYID